MSDSAAAIASGNRWLPPTTCQRYIRDAEDREALGLGW
jgi:hypothetical protein